MEAHLKQILEESRSGSLSKYLGNVNGKAEDCSAARSF